MKQSINCNIVSVHIAFSFKEIHGYQHLLHIFIDLNCWCLCEPRTNNALNVLRSSAMFDNYKLSGIFIVVKVAITS